MLHDTGILRPLTVQEWDRALQVIIPSTQKATFSKLTRDTRKEPQRPRQIQSSAMKALKGSQLYHLNPFLDSHGIPHIRGRLRRTEIEYGEKHLITLPKTTMFHS